MLKNYFSTTIRTYFIGKKGGNRAFFTYINLTGLIIGLAAFLIIAHLVRYELSYDNFFQNGENIYRVKVQKVEDGQITMESAKTYPGVGSILKSDIPGVENFARVLAEECMLHYKERDVKFNRQKTYWADPAFISMLGLEFIEQGSISIDRPYTAVISYSAAKKYFGENWEGKNTPIGKTIWLNENLPFVVQGVYKDLPPNSHMEFDFIVSYVTLVSLAGPDFEHGMPPFYNAIYTYISLAPGTSAKKVEELAQKAVSEKIPTTRSGDARYQFYLQPMRSIHLNSNLADELKPNGNKIFVLALSLSAFLILIVAWINFINLSTARAMDRAKEVGVRKVIGSSKRQLVAQFIFEALFACVLAAIGAVMVVFFISGYIENLVGIKTSIFSWKGEDAYSWFLFIGIMLAGGLLSSIYPAIILSSFKTVAALKGNINGGYGKGYLRKSLIVFQFFFAVLLLSCTGAIYYQINFMRQQPLGMNPHQVLVLLSPRSMIGNEKRAEYFRNFRDKLLNYPAIEKVGSSACIPGEEFLLHREGVRQTEKDDGKNLTYDIAWVDEGYLPALGFKLVAGRNFSDQPGEGMKTIVNETAVRVLGFRDSTEAIGKILITGKDEQYQIAGVVHDAHYERLQKTIRPLLLFYGHNYEFGFFSLKINSTNINQVVGTVQTAWAQIYPNDPFDYFFLDSFFDKQYKNDYTYGKVFGMFSFLGIFIACLGLIGLVSFTTFRRTKEIGIRKVLGATVLSITGLLVSEFFKPIVLACLIAIPVSYVVISKWLNTFAYHFQFVWWMYLLPLVLINLLALFAISWQSLKAASGNPVKALKEK